MKTSDEKYYEAQERHKQKHDLASAMAQNRGKASIEWHKENRLTPETLPLFKTAMKKADKEFKKNNPNLF